MPKQDTYYKSHHIRKHNSIYQTTNSAKLNSSTANTLTKSEASRVCAPLAKPADVVVDEDDTVKVIQISNELNLYKNNSYV